MERSKAGTAATRATAVLLAAALLFPAWPVPSAAQEGDSGAALAAAGVDASRILGAQGGSHAAPAVGEAGPVQGTPPPQGRPRTLEEVEALASRNFRDPGYDEAQRFMFGTADNFEKGGVRGVMDAYSDVFVPGTSDQGETYREQGDQNRDGYVDKEGMNVEHLWPQSCFGKALPMRADVHQLLTTFAHPNSARGTLPFSEVASGTGYSNAAGAKSDGSRFEPPDSAKGRVARALMYFYARYRSGAIYQGACRRDFFERQAQTLKRWNAAFPPDARERGRNDAVERFQGNRNPFIDDPSLADLLN